MRPQISTDEGAEAFFNKQSVDKLDWQQIQSEQAREGGGGSEALGSVTLPKKKTNQQNKQVKFYSVASGNKNLLRASKQEVRLCRRVQILRRRRRIFSGKLHDGATP